VAEGEWLALHGLRSSSSARIISIFAGLASVIGLMAIGGSAGAVPAPTITQVQHKLARLDARANRLGQAYDQVLSQLAQANQRLAILNRETARYQGTFDALRSQIGRIAMIAYEEAGATAPVALLTARSPQQVLSQSSILSELSAANDAEIGTYLSASRVLLSAERTVSLQRAVIARMRRSLRKQIAVLNRLKAQQQALLAQLSPAQQVSLGLGGCTTGCTYHGTTATQAGKAVAFAYSKLGCKYLYGGTGPCTYGYDCSGLVQAAWAAAGVAIPRVSWDQLGDPNFLVVSLSNLRPGDILGFGGGSHVGIYVGGGYMIHAPTWGVPVQKVKLAGYWLSSFYRAVRP
jgi:cell wall-associated NlpC family hydrolase